MSSPIPERKESSAAPGRMPRALIRRGIVWAAAAVAVLVVGQVLLAWYADISLLDQLVDF